MNRRLSSAQAVFNSSNQHNVHFVSAVPGHNALFMCSGGNQLISWDGGFSEISFHIYSIATKLD